MVQESVLIECDKTGGARPSFIGTGEQRASQASSTKISYLRSGGKAEQRILAGVERNPDVD